MDNQGFKYCSIGNSNVCFYNILSKKEHRIGKSQNSKSNLNKAYKSTSLTSKSKKQINKIIYHWANCVELIQELKLKDNKIKRRSLSMVTLTLPSAQILTDKDCNSKYLSPFINRLKKYKPDIHYLWVAEKQKNGSIHYHIIIDLYLGKIWIRNIWNSILANGPEFDNYKKKFNKVDPPSTQVDSLKKIHNSGAYITKYITKLDILQEIKSKKWDCDSKLLQISKMSLISKAWYIEEFAHYCNYFQIKKYEDSFFKIFTFNSNFHKSFKFLNMYHDLLPQLMFYYSDLYCELKLNQFTDTSQIKHLRPPLITQVCLDF
jgi:hypothetical protein